MGVIDINKLQRYAIDYDNALRVLPYFTFDEFAAALKLNVLEVADELRTVHFRRKAGATGPYKPGMNLSYPDEIGNVFESSLKPELTVSKLKDNINNYKEKRLLSNAGERVNNQTKTHPLEKIIVDSMVKSHIEDVIFSMFFASRNENVFSPLTAFDGFFTQLDKYKTSHDITLANKNMVRTGTFGSNDGVDDYDRLVDFVRQGSTFLRRNCVLLYTDEVELICRNALYQKMKYWKIPTSEELWAQVKSDANAQGMIPVSHEAFGSGQSLIMYQPGLFQIGIDTKSSNQFVQVRQIFEDPNEIQYWIQGGYGTSIQDIHNKVFQCNEKSNVGNDLSGDYITGGAISGVITGAEGAWKIDDGVWNANNVTVTGVSAGAHVVSFKEVSGFTTPGNVNITVVAGLDYTANGAYVTA